MPLAIPALEVLADALLLLLYLVGWIVALGLLYAWNATFHYVFQAIARTLRFSIPIPHVHTFRFDLGGWANYIDTTARNALSDYAVGCEILVGKFFHALGWIVGSTIREIAAVSQDMQSLGHWLVHTYVPTYVHGVTDLLHSTTKVVTSTVHTVETKVIHVTKVVQATATHAAHAATAAVAGTIDIALPRSVRDAWKEIHGLTKRNLNITRRLHRLEALFGATAAAAVVANALGLSLSCIKPGGNLGRMFRSVCGAPSWLIRFLVAGAIEGFIVSDLCDFSNLIVAETERLRPSLMAIVNVENELVGCHDFDGPRVLRLGPVSLPPLVDPVSLAA